MSKTYLITLAKIDQEEGKEIVKIGVAIIQKKPFQNLLSILEKVNKQAKEEGGMIFDIKRID